MKLFKQFSLYTVFGFLNAGISFLLMPYLSHFINPSGYGILSMVNSFVTILIPLVGLTAAGYVAVEYYQVRNREEFASIFSSVQLIPLLPCLLILVFSLLFSRETAAFLEIPLQKQYWIPLAVAISFFTIYFEALSALNVIEKKAVTYVKFNLSRVLVEVALTLLFVSYFKWGWEGRLYSWCITSLIFFIISLIYFKKQDLLSSNIKKKYIVAGIFFGLPLILHTIGKFVINQSDRIFIAKMVSIEEAGIYNIGYQVGMVMLLLVTAAANFIQPFLYERLALFTEKAKLEIVRTTYIIIIMLFVFLLAFTTISPLLFEYIIDESYRGGIVYVFWTGLSYFFWGIYILFSGYIFYTKKTSQLGLLAIFNVVLNIVLNYFLIQEYGAIGAVYATCISFFIVALLVVWQSVRLFSLPWLEFNRIWKNNNSTPNI